MMPLLHRTTPGSMDVAAAAQSAGGTPALSGDEGPASVLAIAGNCPVIASCRRISLEGRLTHACRPARLVLPDDVRSAATCGTIGGERIDMFAGHEEGSDMDVAGGSGEE